MGAEPTVRNDLPELIEEINKIALRPIMILTNGVNLSRIDYASQFTKFDNVYFTFGLNHPDYQGHVVRYKQEDGLKNCKTLGLKIKNISYTIEGFYQLEYCLNEIQQFNKENQYCNMYRIRVGADIGRCPDQEKMFISELKNFVASGGSYAAKLGQSDDLVMSTILAIRMATELKNYVPELDNQIRDSNDYNLQPMPFVIV